MRTWVVTVLVAFLAPAGLWAQLGNSGSPSSMGGIPFGNGQTPSLSYAGETTPTNMFVATLSTQTTYDTAALQTTAPHIGDVIYSLGPQFSLVQTEGNFTAALDYQPYFNLYQRLTEYDRVNQSAAADLSYKFGPHLTVRVRDSFMHQTGMYQPQSGTDFVAGLGAPTALNTTVYSPLLSERINNTRFDAIYKKSARTSFTLFGDYANSHFGSSPASTVSVLSTESVTGGAQYAYRASEHLTFAALYTFQPMRFLGALPAGSASQTTVQSALLSLGWQASPTLSLSLFGGPQYTVRQGFQGTTSTPAGTASTPGNHFSWAAGGTLTKQSGKTALVLSVSRAVSNGGAWLPAVTASTVNIGLRRHLVRRWDGSFNLIYAQNQYLGSLLGGGRLDSETADVTLSRSLGERATARLSYDFIQQQGTGLSILGEDFNHSRVSFGIFYQLRKSPLGR